MVCSVHWPTAQWSNIEEAGGRGSRCDTGPQTIALIVTLGGREMAPGQISYQKNIGYY